MAATRADIERGTWLSPEQGLIPLRQYADTWLHQKPNLRLRSREQYEINLRLHILPKLGDKDLSKLSPSMVRTWHAELLAAGKPGASTVAKCYRLLHAICATAVEDEVIPKNPCLLRGASTDQPAERPVATIEQVYAIADAIEPSLRMMVLFATFTGLRLGELRALRRDRVDMLHTTVRVVEQYQDLSSGELVLGLPGCDDVAHRHGQAGRGEGAPARERRHRVDLVEENDVLGEPEGMEATLFCRGTEFAEP